MEKISVIIPVYNTEKYLEKSVRSVMSQTYPDLEIICVNDGSTDHSLSILERLQAEDGRIVIVNKKNGGLGDARNSGLEHVTSEWVTFVDSDDYIEPDTLEIVSKAFSYKPDMVHFGVNIVIEDGYPAVPTDEKYYAVRYSGFLEPDDSMIMNSDVAVWNKLFRKSILDRYGIRFEKIYYEDFPFTLQYLFSVKSVYYIQNKLYNYVRHAGTIMAETFAHTPRAIDHVRAMESLLQFLDKNGLIVGHEALLSLKFTDCYYFSIMHTTPEKFSEIIDYARKLYDGYPFMHDIILQKEENGNVVFVKKKQHSHHSTVMLQKIFSLRVEFMENYKLYKVMRLFGVVIYRKPKVYN